MFVIVELGSGQWTNALISTIDLAGTAIRPHMTAQYLRQFKIYLVFAIS